MQTILLVDTGDKLHEALPFFLGQIGFKVVHATNLTRNAESSNHLSLNMPNKALPDGSNDSLHPLKFDLEQIPVFIVNISENARNTPNSYIANSLNSLPTPSTKNRVLGPLELYLDQGIVKYKDKRLQLTRREFSLIAFLSANPGIVFSREELLSNIWGDVFMGTGRTVDQHISQLRAYIGSGSIETIRSRGYRLNPDYFQE